MSQALIISNKNIINDVYKANLKAYVATNVTIKSSSEEAIKLLAQAPDLDFIITFANIGTETTYDNLVTFFKTQKKKIPIIVVGYYAQKDKNIIHISDYFSVKEIVRECAKILEITAKEMFDKEVPDHYPIPIKLFTVQGHALCDTFYKKTNEDNSIEYIKICSEGEKIKASVEQYVEEGFTELYVPSPMRLDFINNVSQSILGRLVDDSVPVEEQVGAIEEGADFIFNELSNNPVVTEEVAKISAACISSIKKVVKDVSDLKSLLMLLLNNKSNYIYKHSILTSYVCNHIIDNISWGGEGQAEKLQFCLFYHDIFLTPIFTKYPEYTSEEALLYAGKLTEREKEVIINHARLASDMIQNFSRLPIGADAIIMQHHGMTKGIGFANNYKDDISPLAKVSIIAEHFVEEFFALLKTKDKITTPIIMNTLHMKFNKSSYKKIIEALAGLNI